MKRNIEKTVLTLVIGTFFILSSLYAKEGIETETVQRGTSDTEDYQEITEWEQGSQESDEGSSNGNRRSNYGNFVNVEEDFVEAEDDYPSFESYFVEPSREDEGGVAVDDVFPPYDDFDPDREKPRTEATERDITDELYEEGIYRGDQKKGKTNKKKEEYDKRKNDKNKPPPFSSCWMRPTMVAVGMGGGILAGYIAGHNREKSSGTTKVNKVGLCLPTSTFEMHLEFILPDYIPITGQERVLVQIFTPDQKLFFQSTLTPINAMPQDIPTIGELDTPAPIGQYRIVFTLEGGNVGGPAILGGIRANGLEFISQKICADLISKGTQTSISIDYPQGVLVDGVEGI